ncbi:GMC oxidoreductase [Macrolepiota fuliginosa MF-IS2]|uniref:pyranose dehydrogenase (acceptor) n=1 Tax=Macrolepiota fuliginosa MF-IS2 TaxID=1400762 RepID=A0A9P6BYE1_9AGAR|nr:GMC oxidoreductase [Macrolepiota fuliginosa MF-IS2]
MFPARRGIYLVSLIQAALCAVQFQHPNDLPGVQYDFVVVGGGNAGAVVATRLGGNRDFKVLVIEAGPSNDAVFATQVPGLAQNVSGLPLVEWNYTTVAQTHAGGKADAYGRAMLLGGCTSHNELVYTRGSRDDYDRWASVVGDENLSWDKLLPYILKAEKWSSPNDPNLSEEGHFDPSVHGLDGKLQTSAPYNPHPLNDLLLETTKELSDEFPFLLDLNDGRPIGIGWQQNTIGKGVRSSSATGYLSSTGDNVHVLLNTRVTRILPTTYGGTDIRTVEFATDPKGPTYNSTATKEVIISGGVINTPQILLNSGIGPKEELAAVGIASIVDNPGIGKNFSDQSAISTLFSTNLPSDAFDQTAALAEWSKSHTGRLADPPHMSSLGWVRLPADANPFKDGSPDPTGGPNSPHVELFFYNVRPPPDGVDNGPGNTSLLTIVVNLNPVSRGSITLAPGSSPFDAPVIDPNLLASPLDTAILLEGIRSAQRLFSSKAFSGRMFGTALPPSNATDAAVVDFIQQNTTPFLHGVGSCGMGPRNANWGAVDPDFKVKGAKGLRIVDASIFPYVTSGHTQAAVYAIAEWASEIIKESWNQ